MKKVLFLSVILLIATTGFSQTQQGCVKTRGRMVDGQLVPGEGLKGATVTIQGRTPVVVNSRKGAFSFPIPANTFYIEEVTKKDYQLLDADFLKKEFTYSPNPLYILMETPDQLLQDQLDSERKIRRTMQRKLQEREDELEMLKAQQKISEEEYRAALQQLYAEQENNEKLIADMAKQYAQIDYDQMDELNRRISDAILNGRLTEADSLLRSKGNMGSRIDKLRREQQAEAQREKELAQELANLETSKAGTQKTLEDIADDCEKYFDLFKLNLEWDSAAYYVTMRAELDTTNADWQFDAAYFFDKQNDYRQAEKYYLRYIGIKRTQNREYALSIGLNNLAVLYSNTQRYDESEAMYIEALEIFRHLAKATPQVYEPYVAAMLNNLADLYRDIQRFTESEDMYMEALEIRRRLAKANPQAYEPNVAMALNNFAVLYNDTQRFTESEAMHLEALGIYKRLAKANPQAYEPDLAMALNNLAVLYNDTQRLTESEAMYIEALEIRKRLAQANPQAYEPDVAKTLNNLAILYKNTQRFDKSETMYLEALEIRRRLAEANPQAYEPDVAKTLNNLAGLYYATQRFTECEAIYIEALGIYRHLTQANLQAYEPYVATMLNNLAVLYNNTRRYTESEAMYIEALEIRRRLAQANPQVYERHLIITLRQLTSLYSTQKDYPKAFKNNLELIPILKTVYESDSEKWRETNLNTLGNQSYYAIFAGQLSQAELYAREALSIDSTQHWISTNLAASLLFQGKYDEAEILYRQLKDEKKDGLLQDFDDFEAAGVIPEDRKADVEKIRKMLNK